MRKALDQPVAPSPPAATARGSSTRRRAPWLGKGVRLRVTPCPKIAASFRGGDFDGMDQEHHPGWARVYALVETGATVRPGDVVTAG